MSDEIGVLVPLQLETTFLPPKPKPDIPQDNGDGDDRSWHMRLRVIPQPVSIDTHTEYVSDEELRAVTAFRTVLNRTDPLTPAWFGTDEHKNAFAVLARTVGPARAAWLADTVPAVEADGRIVATRPPDTPEFDHPARVRGLPARLQVAVWTYDADGEVLHPIGSLPQDKNATLASVLDLPDLRNPDDFFEHWVSDWKQACEIGLGGTFELPAGLTPQTLGGVTVWGIGDQSPGVLIDHHALSGELAEVVLGSATHSMDGDPTATSTADPTGAAVATGSPDTEAYWQALLRRLAGTTTSLDDLVTRFVAGEPIAGLARPTGREQLFADLDLPETVRESMTAGADAADLVEARSQILPETGLAPLLMHALWPVLWGSFAHDEWRLPPDVVGPLTRWALENVNPEGPLPTLRVGDEPYALLPVTRVDTWRPAEVEAAAEALTSLIASLQTLRRDLHAAVRPNRTVPKGGNAVAHYTDLLLRGGASARFGTRRSAPRALLQAWHGPGPWDLRDAQLAFLGLPDPVPDPFVEISNGPNSVGMPLVLPHRWTYWGLRDLTSRVPLPALIEIARGRTLVNPNLGGGVPLTLGNLFDPDAYYIDANQHADGERPIGVVPDSLLARLLLQSVLTTNTWQAGPLGDELAHAVGPGFGDEGTIATALQVALLLDPGDGSYHWRDPSGWPTDPNSWTQLEDPQGQPVAGYPEYTTSTCPPELQRRLERALGAVLDTVSTRIDPWLTAVAWQRLRAATADSATPHRLGAYGWVHGPFDGKPGPTESGLLHTPSQAQTLAATLLRDDFREHLRTGTRNDRGQVPSGIALTGAAVRFAQAYVEDLRDGHHPDEIVGREVERILTTGVPSPYRVAEALRLTYPMHTERPDARQTCQGLHALARLLENPAEVPGVNVPPGQLRELKQLHAALDAIGDLALLDGALHAASGRPASASAALRGASGSAPAALPEFPLTPAPGRELRTIVLAVVPGRKPAVGDEAARLAEPSVAAFLDTQLGTDWTWSVHFEDGTDRPVRLTDLGLRPIDTLVFSPAQLRTFAATAAGVRGAPLGRPPEAGPSEAEEFAVSLVADENRAWEVRVDDVLHGITTPAQLGLAPRDLADQPELDAVVLEQYFHDQVPDGANLRPVPPAAPTVWTVRDRLGTLLGVFDATTLKWPNPEAPPADHEQRLRLAVGASTAVVIDPPELARASRLCALLGQPATEQDLARSDPDVPASTTAYEELLQRYSDVHTDLEKTVNELELAHAPGADDAFRSAAIRRGALWGVTPDTTPADAATLAAALTSTPVPHGATDLAAVAEAMASALRKRLTDAPPTDLIPTPGNHSTPMDNYLELREKGRPDGVAALARALSALVAPQGNLPILTFWVRASLTAHAPLEPRPDSLEETWLTVVASVRPPLARIEAHQLDTRARGKTALAAWSSDADPWRTSTIKPGAADRNTGTPFGYLLDPFVVAFGPPGSLDETHLAVGVIDSYSEVVPLPQRDTHAAFGFNAPAARAPQTILLAVPPNADDPLTDADIAVMLTELRELVVARSARMPDLIQRGGLLRTTWLPQDEPTSTLDPSAYLNAR